MYLSMMSWGVKNLLSIEALHNIKICEVLVFSAIHEIWKQESFQDFQREPFVLLAFYFNDIGITHTNISGSTP